MKTTIEKTDGKCDTAQTVQWLNSQLAMKANGVYELTCCGYCDKEFGKMFIKPKHKACKYYIPKI